MAKAKLNGSQVNELQQRVVKSNVAIDSVDESEYLESDDGVEGNEPEIVDGNGVGNEGRDDENAIANKVSNATTTSQKDSDGDDSSGDNDDEDFNDIADFGDYEFPPLTDEMVQVPDAAARYGISKQAFYKRINYLGFKTKMIGGKSYFSREQMEVFDKLALWIRENGSLNGFLGDSALVVSQGSSVTKKSNNKSNSTIPRSGKASRDRQLSDAQIVAKRAELRAAQMLIGEDVAVNYLLENPDKISDEVMDEVLDFREGMQSSMVDSAVGKPFDTDTFAKDILNCFAQTG